MYANCLPSLKTTHISKIHKLEQKNRKLSYFQKMAASVGLDHMPNNRKRDGRSSNLIIGLPNLMKKTTSIYLGYNYAEQALPTSHIKPILIFPLQCK
jgi:hypothetical protein